MAYPIVRTDLMAGTVDPAKLRTCKYFVSTTPTAINNGTVVKLDSILLNASSKVENREVWKAVAPAANEALKDVVLVATPELMYEKDKSGLDQFQNPANGLCRGYIMCENDIFSLTDDAFDTSLDTVAAGNVVELQADVKMKIVSSLTSGSTQVGKVIQVEQVGSKTYYVVRVC